MSIRGRLFSRRLKKNITKAMRDAPTAVRNPYDLTTGPAREFTETLSHFRLMVPSDSQNAAPSCAGHAVANIAEWAINNAHYNDGSGALRGIPNNKQICGWTIWERSRMENHGDALGGLSLIDAAETAVKLGIMGSTPKLITDSEELFKILPSRPVMVGMRLTEVWYDNPNSFNGYIEPDILTDYGHAVVLAGLTYQNGLPYVHLMNSWGTRWGAGGIGTMSVDHFIESCNGAVDLGDQPGANWDQYLN